MATWATWGLHMGSKGMGMSSLERKCLGPGGTRGGCRWLRAARLEQGEVLFSAGVAVITSSTVK